MAARSSSESSAITTRRAQATLVAPPGPARSATSATAAIRRRSIPALVGLGVEVQDEVDGGLGRGVVEGLAIGRALDRDAEDRRPEPPRLRGRLGADLPAASDQA